MKLSLALFGIAVADLLPSSLPAGCPKITCVMFCKNGMQKDSKGCDICSCARDGKVATGTASCKRDADGCCSELGVAWCPDQNTCVSTHGAVIPCKSWTNNVPAAAANAQITVLSGGVIQSTTFGNSAVQPSVATPNTQTSFFAGTANFMTNPVPLPATTTSRTSSSSSLSTGEVSTGLKTSTNGPSSLTVNAGLSTSTRPSCSPVMCAMFCPNGFKKDANGCELCSCAGSTSSACPSTADCAGRACAGGYAKDTKGCPTCVCLSGSAPVTTSSTSGIARASVDANVAGSAQTHSDALVALDRPTIASNPCLPANGQCKKNQKCVPAPKQCVTTPCPQFKCVKKPLKAGR